MPLHLLGKKSWNVYNVDNIARVRYDEVLARERKQAVEEEMRERDALDRLAILRGETPIPPRPLPETADASRRSLQCNASGEDRYFRERKKRKRPGEDDTDFEMRLALERTNSDSNEKDQGRPLNSFVASSAPIIDKSGHIDLFDNASAQGFHGHGLKTEPGSTLSEKRARDERDPYVIRLADAAGRGKSVEVGLWYAELGKQTGPTVQAREDVVAKLDVPDTEARGRRFPSRKEGRIDLDDPLVMMKSGARQIRDLARERKRTAEEQERERDQLKRETEAEHGRRKRRRDFVKRHENNGNENDRKRAEDRARREPINSRSRDRNEDRNRRSHGEDDRIRRHRASEWKAVGKRDRKRRSRSPPHYGARHSVI